jgi:hypothetical protein
MDSIKVKPVVVNTEIQPTKCDTTNPTVSVHPTQMSHEKSIPVATKKSNIVLKKSVLTSVCNLDVSKQSSNTPVKVLALKPVPPPKVLPKNVIKINVNSRPPSSNPNNVYSKPITNLPEQIILPKFNETSSQSNEKGGGTVSSFFGNAYSKLQSSLKAAGLITGNFTTSTPSKQKPSSVEGEMSQQISVLQKLPFSPIKPSRLDKI